MPKSSWWTELLCYWYCQHWPSLDYFFHLHNREGNYHRNYNKSNYYSDYSYNESNYNESNYHRSYHHVGALANSSRFGCQLQQLPSGSIR